MPRRPFSARGPRPTGRLVALLTGVAIAALAWVAPLDLFGMGYHFTVHMSQHLLLALVAPPLLLLGAPAWWARRLLRRGGSHPGTGLAVFAFLASALFNANVWIWHAPPLYQAMLRSEPLHHLSNLLYVVTGLLFWWPLLSPLHAQGQLYLGGKLLYLFLSDMPMMLLGAGLTFARPLYTLTMLTPVVHTMRIAALDQQLGGLLMWIGGTLYFIVLASVFFLRWMLHQERLDQLTTSEAKPDTATVPGGARPLHQEARDDCHRDQPGKDADHPCPTETYADKTRSESNVLSGGLEARPAPMRRTVGKRKGRNDDA
jgi:cytochrome c oxidase assembly factor CtaG